jgi:hypothetical protein
MRIDGDVSQVARHEMVTEFQTNSQMKAAVLSIKAAGVGLTLTVTSPPLPRDPWSHKVNRSRFSGFNPWSQKVNRSGYFVKEAGSRIVEGLRQGASPGLTSASKWLCVLLQRGTLTNR